MKKGFTLIELLTVLAIIVIISTISFFSHSRVKESLSILRNANALASEIRKAQEWAISVKYTTSSAVYGYGIFIHPPTTTVSLFKDIDNDNNMTTTEILESFQLDPDITISSVSPSPLTIVFKPPYPKTYINNGATSTFEIHLKSPSGYTKTIIGNRSGLITVE